jgi:mannitol 2-dehydrogenase
MKELMDRETGPTIPAVPGIDLSCYKLQLVDRFANARIKDTVERVNTDAPINLLLDPIRDRLAANAEVRLLALALAAWLRRVRGEDERSLLIEVIHPQAKLLRERAIEGGRNPRPLLAITSLFGTLGQHTEFVNTLAHWLSSLYDVGATATLARARRELEF